MKLIEQLERLKYIHQLIEKQETGTAEEFAKKLHISKRQLHNILENLKLMAAPIEYDAKQKTYFYSKQCEINFSFDIKVLNDDGMRKINGGTMVPIPKLHLDLYDCISDRVQVYCTAYS